MSIRYGTVGRGVLSGGYGSRKGCYWWANTRRFGDSVIPQVAMKVFLIDDMKFDR